MALPGMQLRPIETLRGKRLGVFNVSLYRFAAMLVAIALISGGVWAANTAQEVSIGAVYDTVTGNGSALVWLLALLGLMLVAAATPFPAEPIAIVSGMLFGTLVGALVTWTFAVIGAYVAYACARWLGVVFRTRSRVLISHRIVQRDTHELDFKVVLVARLIPLVPFFLINYSAGLAGMKSGRYILATSVGIVPLCLLLSWVGANLPTP